MTQSQHRPDGRDAPPPTPWLWLGLGLIVTCVAILVSFWIATALLTREPLTVTGLEPSPPTIIRLTAPPTAPPTSTPETLVLTPIPTLTAVPTADRSQPPAQITIDFYARVINTDGIGVSVRGGPSTANARIELAPEGALLLIIGGPEPNAGFDWWQVRLTDGTEGWVAGDFLEPAAAP